MIYTKPEINILGDATRIIQFTGLKGGPGVFDPTNPMWLVDPAYDLDE